MHSRRIENDEHFADGMRRGAGSRQPAGGGRRGLVKIRYLASAAMAVLLAARASADPRAIPGATFPQPFGVNIHYTRGVKGETAQLAKAFRVARMDFVWSSIERKKGVYDWSNYDHLIRDLEANGVRPLFILDYGNDLYQSGAPRTPEAIAGYARFAAAAAKRYADHKVMWEFWNEPNGGFWGGSGNAGEYARMVNEAAAAMRKADPRCTLLVGAFAGFPWDFIEDVFKAGTLRWADAVSVHPYRGGFPETVVSDYDRLRALIAQYAPGRDIPIISGEWGYSTNTKTGVSEERQAQYIVRQRLINISQGIPVSIWYDWKDDGPDPTENEHRFGSVRQNLQPKPSYTAALVFNRTLGGYTFTRMLEDGPLQFTMLLRNADGESALVVWTTGPTRRVHVPGTGVKIVDMLGAAHSDDKAERDVSAGPSPRYVLLGRSATMDLPASWSWASPGTVLAAGTARTIDWTIRNPGDQTRTFYATFGVTGGEAKPASALVELKPGESRSVPVRVTMWKRSQDGALNVEVASRSGGGNRSVDRARIPVHISNPLRVSAEPAGPGAVPVVLTSPKGFHSDHMTVTLSGVQGLEGVKAVPVPRTTNAEVSLSVPARKVASDYVFGVSVGDGGREVASLPPRGYFRQYDFETSALGGAAEGFAAHFEGDAKGGTFRLATVRGAGHGNTADLRVDFTDGWSYVVVTPLDQKIPDDAVAVDMWVHGDASGDYLRYRVIDAKGQVYQPDFGRVRWSGWRWITARLDNPAVGSWGGPQDGVMHKPLRWDSIVLLDSENRKAHTSHIQFDDITIITTAPGA
jgi:hypothetical protein